MANENQGKTAGQPRHEVEEKVKLLGPCSIGGKPYDKDDEPTVRGDQADWLRKQKLIA